MPNLRHLEYFHDHVRIEHLLFDGALQVCDGALRPDARDSGWNCGSRTPSRSGWGDGGQG